MFFYIFLLLYCHGCFNCSNFDYFSQDLLSFAKEKNPDIIEMMKVKEWWNKATSVDGSVFDNVSKFRLRSNDQQNFPKLIAKAVSKRKMHKTLCFEDRYITELMAYIIKTYHGFSSTETILACGISVIKDFIIDEYIKVNIP